MTLMSTNCVQVKMKTVCCWKAAIFEEDEKALLLILPMPEVLSSTTYSDSQHAWHRLLHYLQRLPVFWRIGNELSASGSVSQENTLLKQIEPQMRCRIRSWSRTVNHFLIARQSAIGDFFSPKISIKINDNSSSYLLYLDKYDATLNLLIWPIPAGQWTWFWA